MKNDNLIEPSPGDPIKASEYSELVRTVKQYQNFLGGQTSSSFTATRQNSLAICRKVVLLATVDAASYNPTTKKLTPASFNAQPLFEHKDQDGTLSFDATEAEPINGFNFYLTAVTVSSGYARFAYMWGLELLIADCEEFSLT